LRSAAARSRDLSISWSWVLDARIAWMPRPKAYNGEDLVDAMRTSHATHSCSGFGLSVWLYILETYCKLLSTSTP